MEEQKMKDLMIDYLEGNLTGELKDFVAKHIEKDKRWIKEFDELKKVFDVMDNSKELEPDASLKTDFEAMLRMEMSEVKLSEKIEILKTVYWNTPKMWMQIAASVTILAVGVLLGINYSSNKAELLALQKEMDATKQLVISSLQNQSASSRLNAVNVSYQMQSIDDEIINALINTMNTDDNANVRLAAVEALTQFVDEEKVRNALIASLTAQDNPVVQIALINLMVQLKESKAIAPLKEILNSEEVIEAVKDEANYGVFILS